MAPSTHQLSTNRDQTLEMVADSTEKKEASSKKNLDNDSLQKDKHKGTHDRQEDFDEDLLDREEDHSTTDYSIARLQQSIATLYRELAHREIAKSKKVFSTWQKGEQLAQFIAESMFLNNNIKELQTTLDREKVSSIEKKILLQIFEIVVSAKKINEYKKPSLKTPDDVYRNFFFLSGYPREVFYLVSVDEDFRLQDSVQISHGSGNRMLLSPREILSQALKMSATTILLIHNHPSGNSIPSELDIDFTKQMMKASLLLGVNLIDHIIIANDYFSFRESKLLF